MPIFSPTHTAEWTYKAFLRSDGTSFFIQPILATVIETETLLIHTRNPHAPNAILFAHGDYYPNAGTPLCSRPVPVPAGLNLAFRAPANNPSWVSNYSINYWTAKLARPLNSLDLHMIAEKSKPNGSIDINDYEIDLQISEVKESGTEIIDYTLTSYPLTYVPTPGKNCDIIFIKPHKISYLRHVFSAKRTLNRKWSTLYSSICRVKYPMA